MRRHAFVIRCGMFVMALMLCAVGVRAADAPADLAVLIREALEKNPEILASQARLEGARQRVPQAESLPDPMLSAGYQNMGFERYSYGEYEFSQWMFEASQTFPFPGKRSLRAEASRKESESLGATHESVRLKIVLRVKELYYDLLLGYRNLDLIRERTALAVRIEEAALARYATGNGAPADRGD
jgi:outer membrane protein TolC